MTISDNFAYMLLRRAPRCREQLRVRLHASISDADGLRLLRGRFLHEGCDPMSLTRPPSAFIDGSLSSLIATFVSPMLAMSHTTVCTNFGITSSDSTACAPTMPVAEHLMHKMVAPTSPM